MEKSLIEACLEAAQLEGVAGVQDLGAAGLSSATVEAADRAGLGVTIDVSQVPRRESGMTPYEVMLSESQERMLVMVEEHAVDRVERVFRKWRLNFTVIGRVTDDGAITLSEGDDVRGRLPIRLLTDPPQYRLQGVEPERQRELRAYDLEALPLPAETPSEVLLKLLASPNIASKAWAYRQYDHHVMTNTVVEPGADAAVLRIKGTRKGIALTTDGNGRYCYLDPHQGGMIAVAEACRNVSTVGAEPIALTDCLNFGNPEKPEVYFQLEECVKGMAAASAAFGGARHIGQRQPVQRDPRQGHLPDADHRRAGPAGGRDGPRRDDLPAGGRRGDAGVGPDRFSRRVPGRQRIPGGNPRPCRGTSHHRPGAGGHGAGSAAAERSGRGC